MKKHPETVVQSAAPQTAVGHQRQRRRNIALLLVLLALVVLIFAISLVQFGRAGHLS